MAMQIQRGLVKYKDRSDIVCIYGITDSGMQYYFLEDGRLANGNIIVTTTLLEAVDPMAFASNIGVIDGNGNIVIPCDNKSIKVITEDVLLAERAQPISETVLESIRLREDPLAATKLVTTPATIKENMSSVMGEDGKFIFNDQFSEATVYDIFGNNLANNEYYSFIGINDQKLFYSKNTVESEIQEYPLYPIDNEVINNEPTANIDVENTEVSKDEIDQSLNSFDESVLTEAPVVPEVEEEVQTETEVYEENTGYEENYYEEEDTTSMPPVSDEYTEDVVVPNENVSVDINNEIDNTQSDSFELPDVDVNAAMPMGDVSVDAETIAEDATNEAINEDALNALYEEDAEETEAESTEDNSESLNIANDVVENTEEEITKESNIEEEVEETNEEIEEEVDNNTDSSFDFDGLVKRIDAKIAELEAKEKNNFKSEDEEESEDYEDYDYDEEDEDDEEGQEDYSDYDDYNDYETSSYDYEPSTTNSYATQRNLFDDVTSTMSNLVELNKNLQSMVDDYEVRLSKCNAARKKLVDLSKSQAREISALNVKVAKLETEKQILETKLAALTPSSNGELARVMADAQNAIGKTQNRMRRKKEY